MHSKDKLAASVVLPRIGCGTCKGTGAQHKWQHGQLLRIYPFTPCSICRGKGYVSALRASVSEGESDATHQEN